MITATAQTLHAPADLSYTALAPILIVLGAALIAILVEAFVADRIRQLLQPLLTAAALVAALIDLITLHGQHRLTAARALAVDGPALLMEGSIVVMALVCVLLFADRSPSTGGGAFVTIGGKGQPPARGGRASRAMQQTESYPLMLFAVGGMMVFVAANNLLLMFVALEVLSLPLYLLAGLARRRRLLSQEAAVKYFLLGAFSSAFFLYGLALLYGYANSVDLTAISRTIGTPPTGQGLVGNDTLLYLGLGLLGVGLLFKAGAAPFHSWTPDVYTGSPTAVTAFMAAATKIAAFGALLRVLYVAFGTDSWDWRPVIWGVAILTMAVGSIVAITQRDIKRMLAYSSIAHAGFILVGVAAARDDGLSSSLFYLVTYGFTTVAAFAVVTLVRNGDAEASDLAQWQGLGRRSPMLAGIFAFLLFSLAGIPLTSGFIGKFAVFQAAQSGHAVPLVVIGLVASAVAAFFYARVVVLMFFQEPPAAGPVVATSIPANVVVALGAAVTLVLGVAPQPVLDLVHRAAVHGFVR